MTMTMSGATMSPRHQGIVGTQAFMAPEILRRLRQQQSGMLTKNIEDAVTEPMLVANDSFGCGCAIAYLCRYIPLHASVLRFCVIP